MALKLDLERLFKIKGAQNKLKFLRSLGFTYSEAETLAYKKPNSLKISHIEKLCLAFQCTPSDLFSVEQSDAKSLPQDHPFTSLIREPVADIPSLLKKLPVDKLTELTKHIESLTK